MQNALDSFTGNGNGIIIFSYYDNLRKCQQSQYITSYKIIKA